jgi:hypothetical protein
VTVAAAAAAVVQAVAPGATALLATTVLNRPSPTDKLARRAGGVVKTLVRR